jgi:hypothetical protein
MASASSYHDCEKCKGKETRYVEVYTCGDVYEMCSRCGDIYNHTNVHFKASPEIKEIVQNAVDTGDLSEVGTKLGLSTDDPEDLIGYLKECLERHGCVSCVREGGGYGTYRVDMTTGVGVSGALPEPGEELDEIIDDLKAQREDEEVEKVCIRIYKDGKLFDEDGNLIDEDK